MPSWLGWKRDDVARGMATCYAFDATDSKRNIAQDGFRMTKRRRRYFVSFVLVCFLLLFGT